MGLKWKPRAFEPYHEYCMSLWMHHSLNCWLSFFHLTTKKPRCCRACVWNIWIDVKLLPSDACNSIQVHHYGSISWRDGQNHQMMWPPAMQQHPGASLRFHFMANRTESPNDVPTSYLQQHPGASLRFLFLGETDRITNWCDHQLPGCCCIAGGHIIWWFCPVRHEMEP